MMPNPILAKAAESLRQAEAKHKHGLERGVACQLLSKVREELMKRRHNTLERSNAAGKERYMSSEVEQDMSMISSTVNHKKRSSLLLEDGSLKNEKATKRTKYMNAKKWQQTDSSIQDGNIVEENLEFERNVVMKTLNNCIHDGSRVSSMHTKSNTCSKKQNGRTEFVHSRNVRRAFPSKKRRCESLAPGSGRKELIVEVAGASGYLHHGPKRPSIINHVMDAPSKNEDPSLQKGSNYKEISDGENCSQSSTLSHNTFLDKEKDAAPTSIKPDNSAFIGEIMQNERFAQTTVKYQNKGLGVNRHPEQMQQDVEEFKKKLREEKTCLSKAAEEDSCRRGEEAMSTKGKELINQILGAADDVHPGPKGPGINHVAGVVHTQNGSAFKGISDGENHSQAPTHLHSTSLEKQKEATGTIMSYQNKGLVHKNSEKLQRKMKEFEGQLREEDKVAEESHRQAEEADAKRKHELEKDAACPALRKVPNKWSSYALREACMKTNNESAKKSGRPKQEEVIKQGHKNLERSNAFGKARKFSREVYYKKKNSEDHTFMVGSEVDHKRKYSEDHRFMVGSEVNHKRKNVENVATKRFKKLDGQNLDSGQSLTTKSDKRNLGYEMTYFHHESRGCWRHEKSRTGHKGQERRTEYAHSANDRRACTVRVQHPENNDELEEGEIPKNNDETSYQNPESRVLQRSR